MIVGRIEFGPPSPSPFKDLFSRGVVSAFVESETMAEEPEQENIFKTFLDETGIGVRELSRLTGINDSQFTRRTARGGGMTKESELLYRILLELHESGHDIRELIKRHKKD